MVRLAPLRPFASSLSPHSHLRAASLWPGRIFATCNYVAPTQPGRYEVDLVVVITNEAGEITCKAHLIGRLDIGEATASKKQT